MRANPEKVPQVHIRGDMNAPWRCVAGAIYNVQISGYPTVGFISNPGRSERLSRRVWPAR
jgi:biopolymer transport protein ExbD